MPFDGTPDNRLGKGRCQGVIAFFHKHPCSSERASQARMCAGSPRASMLPSPYLVEPERSFPRSGAGVSDHMLLPGWTFRCLLDRVLRAAFARLEPSSAAGDDFGLPINDASRVLEWQTVRPVADWNDDKRRTCRGHCCLRCSDYRAG
jgi:hypothetical protein